MINIIRQGRVKKLKYQITCSTCETEFTYEREDIVSDFREGDFVLCPCCKESIMHKNSNARPV
jgi:NAD-dependent SIR2 family protein deacetylase